MSFLALLAASPAFAADEIHWTITGPTSVTLDWRGTNNSLRYGLSSSYGATATGVAPSPLPFSTSGPFYEARLSNLIPGATYHYSVAGGGDHLFHTPPATGAAFTVYVEGDIGDSDSYPRVAAVQALIADGRPDLVLVTGDLTYANAHGQSAVDQHFNDVMVWSQDAPYMPAWGNHEWDSSGDDFRNYKGRFDLAHPQTSPGAPSAGCCGEDWSWFDYGNVRFITYPEPFSGAWSDWNTRAKTLMDQAQADPTIRFIVTYGHRPAYSSGHHPGDATLASYLDALGSTHTKYVLNLNGHSHDYERTKPQHGVTHVTAGIGGATLEEDPSGSCLYDGGCPAPAWSAFRAYHHGAVRLTVSAASIHGEAICGPAGDSGSNLNDVTCAVGDAFDSFVIGSPDLAPVVTAPAIQVGAVGTPIVVRITAHDPDGDAIQSLTADLSKLPADGHPSFQVAPGDSVGTLSWTPDRNDTGSYAVPFKAQNALISTATTLVHVTGTVDAGSSPPPRSLALESARPNPAVSAVSIVYSLPSAEPVQLELADALGRILVRLDLGSPGPGRHTYLLGRSPDMAPGFYWLRLTQARHTQVAKIAFLR